MKTSTFALLAGIAYLGAGLLGLVPALLIPPPAEAPPTSFGLLYGYLLGLFPMNIVLTALHLGMASGGSPPGAAPRMRRSSRAPWPCSAARWR